MKKILYLALFFVVFFSGCSTKVIYQPSQDIPQQKIIDTPSMHKATMKPYQINGKWYYPTTVEIGQTFDGIASWYGADFHGKYTSNGEIYDMNKKTAAHKTFPMNTVVKVTNKNNNKSTIVRINDRGPFVENRIIDLSRAAAMDIGMIGSGTAPVRLEVIGFGGVIESPAIASSTPKKVEISDFFVQIGAFRKEDGAILVQTQFNSSPSNYKAIIKKGEYLGAPIYRVWVGGFRSEEEAKDFIKDHPTKGSFIVRE